jgi:hypothetical protein
MFELDWWIIVVAVMDDVELSGDMAGDRTELSCFFVFRLTRVERGVDSQEDDDDAEEFVELRSEVG